MARARCTASRRLCAPSLRYRCRAARTTEAHFWDDRVSAPAMRFRLAPLHSLIPRGQPVAPAGCLMVKTNIEVLLLSCSGSHELYADIVSPGVPRRHPPLASAPGQSRVRLRQARGWPGSRGTDLESIKLKEVASGGVTAFSDQSARTRIRFPDMADR